MLEEPKRSRLGRSSRKLGTILGIMPSVIDVLKPNPPLSVASTNVHSTTLVQRTPPHRCASPKKVVEFSGLRRRRIEKLKRQLGENVPPELLFAATATLPSKRDSLFSPLTQSSSSSAQSLRAITDNSVASLEVPRVQVTFQTLDMDYMFTLSPPLARSITRRGTRTPDRPQDDDASLKSVLFASSSSIMPKITTPTRTLDDSFLDFEAAQDLVSSSETSLEHSDTSITTSLAFTPPEHVTILNASGLRRLTVHMPLSGPFSAEFDAVVNAHWEKFRDNGPADIPWIGTEEKQMYVLAPELSAFKFTFPEPISRSGLDLSREYKELDWSSL